MLLKSVRRLSFLNSDLGAILLLLSCWITGILIVGPSGDFPLNDDWAYARGVYSLVEEGKLRLDTWPAMTLIAQIGVGWIYCEIFGFSFEVLRWSTLINSLLCIIICYFLARKVTVRPLATFVALLLLFNSLFFSLSFTFMTEVHFLLPLLGACLFFSQYIEKQHYGALLVATIFSVYATLVRQPGLLVPLAFGIILFLHGKTTTRKLVSLLPFVVSIVCLQLYYSWQRVNFPELFKVGDFGDLLTNLTSRTADHFLDISVSLLLLPPLFLLPLIILLLPSVDWNSVKKSYAALLFSALILVFVCYYRQFFPTENVIYNLGLGPRLLKGASLYPNNIDPIIGSGLWNARAYLALLSTLGISVLLIANLPFPRKLFRRDGVVASAQLIKWGLGLFCAGYMALILLVGSFFDRYTLILVPGLAIMALHRRPKFSKIFSGLAIGFLIFNALFSLTATHDYLSWNRARNEANNDLRAAEIPPTFVDAGFEINGWLEAGPDRFNSPATVSWWFVSEDDYAIAFDELDGFKKWETYEYTTLLPPGKDSLFLLHKDAVTELSYADFPVSTNLEEVGSDPLNFTSTDSRVEFNGANLRSDEQARSGNYSMKLGTEHIYGLTTKFWGIAPGDSIIISAWRYPAGTTAGIVINSDYQRAYYLDDAQGVAIDENGWEKVTLSLAIPPYTGTDRMSIFIWNRDGQEVWWDDMVVERKKKEN